MAELQNFRAADYEAVCAFFRALNREDRRHINWNWARFEWMFAHPEFEKASMEHFGLWWEDGRVVGAAIYDMYFGECFCGVLPGFENLYPAVLAYAWDNLRDASGLGVAVCDDSTEEIRMVQAQGFAAAEQEECIAMLPLNQERTYVLPADMKITCFDPAQEPERFQWLLWQGFNHGTDRQEFEREDPIVPQLRPHLNKELSVAVADSKGEYAAYCCVWYDERTDYAYVEPVCTIPQYRGMGLGKAVVYEALNRARRLGARMAYVISDQEFYSRLGFEQALHFTFWWRTE